MDTFARHYILTRQQTPAEMGNDEQQAYPHNENFTENTPLLTATNNSLAIHVVDIEKQELPKSQAKTSFFHGHTLWLMLELPLVALSKLTMVARSRNDMDMAHVCFVLVVIGQVILSGCGTKAFMDDLRPERRRRRGRARTRYDWIRPEWVWILGQVLLWVMVGLTGRDSW